MPKTKSDLENRYEDVENSIKAAERKQQSLMKEKSRLLEKQRTLGSKKYTESKILKNLDESKVTQHTRIKDKISRYETDIDLTEKKVADITQQISAETSTISSLNSRLNSVGGQMKKEQAQNILQKEGQLVDANINLKNKQAEAAIISAHKTNTSNITVAQMNAATEKFKAERANELQANAHDHADHMVRLNEEIAIRAAEFQEHAYIERSNIDVQSHLIKAKADGKITRKNITHETNERMRLEKLLASLSMQQDTHKANIAMRLMVLKNLLKKDFATHQANLGKAGAEEKLEDTAAMLQMLEEHEAQQNKKLN